VGRSAGRFCVVVDIALIPGDRADGARSCVVLEGDESVFDALDRINEERCASSARIGGGGRAMRSLRRSGNSGDTAEDALIL
jgi:hypothetical protein